MIESGSVVFAKTIQNPFPPTKGTKAHWKSLKAKGHFITVVLGHQPPKADPITLEEAKQLLHSIGYFSGDDIEAVFGKKGWEKFAKFLVSKAGKVNGIVKADEDWKP